MGNRINAIFYNFNSNDLENVVEKIQNVGYSLQYSNISDLHDLKSELKNSTLDILVVDNDTSKSSLEEILEFIEDLERNISVLIVSDNINMELVQLAFKDGYNDIVPKSDSCQLCIALIRNYEKTKAFEQLDFTKKELLRSQKSQNEHEYFLNQIIESTTNPIFYKGKAGRYLGCNKAFANFIGLPKEKIIGKTVFEVSPEELAQKYFEMDQEFFENPDTQQYEYQVAHSEGHIMDVIFYKTAIRDEEGNVTGLLGHMFDITKRKKLENELRKEKDLAQNVLDTSNEMFVSMDLNGNITSVNKKTCEVFKCGKQFLIGKNWFNDIISKNEVELSKKVFNEIINNKANLNEPIERKIVTPENEEKKILWQVAQIKNPDGKIVGILASGREIIEGKIEQRLELRERRFRFLIENLQEGIGIVDLNENVIFSNMAFDYIFGFEPGEIVGKNISEFILREDVEKVFKETENRKSDIKSKYKIRIRRADGKERTISVSSVPWKNENSVIAGTLAVITDITAQEFSTMRLEKKIKIENSIIKISSQFISTDHFDEKLSFTLKELNKIIEAERYAMFVIQNNKIVLLNTHVNDIVDNYESDYEDVPLQNIEYSMAMLESLDFIFYDDISKLPDEGMLEKQIFKRYNIFNFLGIPFYSESKLAGFIAIINIFDVNDWTIEDLSVLRTITEIIGHAYSRNKAEEQVRQLHLDLITKNKELEQVVYVTSHDIRSPVVNILGFSDEMTKALNKLANKIFDESNTINNKDDIEFLLDKDVPQILNFIKISGQKIDKLLLALLKLSRLGRAAINKVNIDMNKLMSSLLDTFEFRIKQENVNIEISDLPDCFTDEVQINQVFSNLIDNAIKYRSPEREPILKISGVENENNVTYCIEDNGIGIPETELDKIFDVFYRINPENQDGEGIGLSLIKKTIERLGGEISVGSEEGKGTKFYITLEKHKN